MVQATIKGYLARNLMFDSLHFFYRKPHKDEKRERWVDADNGIGDVSIPDKAKDTFAFSEVKWENEEPTPAEMVIRVAE